MADKRESIDELSDAQLEHLLKLAYDAPEPDASFLDTLTSQLDREFEQSHGSRSTEEEPAESHFLQNGVAHAVEQEAPTEGTTELSSETSAVLLQQSTHTWRRLAVTLVAAASLLVAISFWSSPTAYGWASMLRALEQCNWVQAVSSDEGLSGWVSASRGVIAARTSHRVIYRNDRQAIGKDFRAAEKVIYQKSLAELKSTSWETRLLSLLLSDAEEMEALLAGSSEGWHLVSETWKEIDGKSAGLDGYSRVIELRVKLESLDEDVQKVELEFLLDPKTELPISGRVMDGAERKSVVEFAYPEQGPATIFALGVPKDTKLISTAVAVGAPVEDEKSTELITADEEIATEEEAEADVSEETLIAEQEDSPHDFFNWDVPETPLSEAALVEQLNEKLASYWSSQGVEAAEAASDEEFLRRVYLDLAGRIPMVSEVYQFLDNPAPDRRAVLVDQLLSSYDYSTHMAAVWRTMLMPDGVNLRELGGTAKFDAWLAERFGENVPYDQQVSELLSAEGRVSESGPLLFYAALKLNPEELAAKTSRVFLASRMECAQCHDHPFDGQISQIDFWGFAAYFAQISRPQGKMEMTSGVLRVKDSTQGEVMLPDTDEVITPSLPGLATDDRKEEASSLSRRQQLVGWLTSRENRRFAAAAVNRVWAHLFGRGLVDPVDDMRIDNGPAVPEVLELLSRDFAASGYDLKRLFRVLVLSDSYQRSSRAEENDLSQTLLFARMNMKSMTADQLYDCIAVATQNEAMLSGNRADGSLARIDNTSRETFIEQFQAPAGQRTDYHAGIPQALTLLHGQIIHGATDLASSGLLNSLSAPFMDDEQRIETLFLATLSRLPVEEERAQMLEHVQSATGEEEKLQAMGNVLWALLNSAEFTFNH